MDMTVKDYLSIARSRITDQFKESNNLDRLIAIWLEGYQELQELAIDVSFINNVDVAKGVELDVIGDIVGQPRELVDISTTGYFGFEEDPGAKSFGSLNNSTGGIYYGLDDPASGNILLADPLYRLFIKAKIRANNTGSTPEDVIASAKELFQTDTVQLLEGEYAEIYLYIGRPWNDPELTVFPGLDETNIAGRLLPVPVSVSINYSDVDILASIEAANAWDSASNQLYYTANTILPQNIPD